MPQTRASNGMRNRKARFKVKRTCRNMECGTSVPLSDAAEPPSRGNALPVDDVCRRSERRSQRRLRHKEIAKDIAKAQKGSAKESQKGTL